MLHMTHFSIYSYLYFFFIIADDLIKVHKFKPTIKWRQSFENYLKTMPPYYIGVNWLNIILQLFIYWFWLKQEDHKKNAWLVLLLCSFHSPWGRLWESWEHQICWLTTWSMAWATAWSPTWKSSANRLEAWVLRFATFRHMSQKVCLCL